MVDVVAGIEVMVGQDGTIHQVTARLSGDVLPPSEPSGVNEDEAWRVVEPFLNPAFDEVDRPIGRPVVIDPFIITDSASSPKIGWEYSFEQRFPGVAVETEATGPFAAAKFVVGSAGNLVFDGPSLQHEPQIAYKCDPHETYKAPRVVLDPIAKTPAYVSFRHLRGLQTSGSTVEAKALSALTHPQVKLMYGDLLPQDHVVQTDVKSVSGTKGITTFVDFGQHHNGVPVEGAYVTVVLNPIGRVDSIFSRYLYRPAPEGDGTGLGFQALREAAVAALVLETCLVTGEGVCPTDSEVEDGFVSEEIVVFSSRIFGDTALKLNPDRYAYKLQAAAGVAFVEVSTGEVLMATTSVRSVLPRSVRNHSAADQIEITEAGPQVPTPHPECATAESFMPRIDQVFADMGWDSFDGTGGRLQMSANFLGEPANAYWCPSGLVAGPCVRQGLVVSPSFMANDVVAHEFVHGITESSSAKLVYIGESGALNESYSDVLANLVFLDPGGGVTWLLGETLALPLRDMEAPHRFHQPGHVSQQQYECLEQQDRCVHTWSGIPNRAAVLVADGIPGQVHPGLGRNKLADLYFNVLVTTVRPADRFVNQRAKTEAHCRDESLFRGRTINGAIVTHQDCDHVERAFNAVGVRGATSFGYVHVKTGFNSFNEVFKLHEGDSLFRGCTIADQILYVETAAGNLFFSNRADGNKISIRNGDIRAEVVSRAPSGLPGDREVSIEVRAGWREFFAVWLEEEYARPIDVLSDADCLSDENSTRRTLFSATRVAEWANFGFGKRGVQTINSGISMPQGCKVQAVTGVHYHQEVGSSCACDAQSYSTSIDDYRHGYSLSSKSVTPGRLDMNMSWWHDGLSGIFARVRYDVIQPDGVDCSVPGATQEDF